ncbi:hypothetical protein [Couchioplanes caeruleus]|uniref:Uncharacterized protein n=2 Tax=Couchioplanes caeruleus TaxID=56438 RepID=A0A1K0FNU3_9ACTN|nr:hypothetical protein [Couchioplanes caeruleus]OJF14509.1 hypothetical protein BG844_09215 [Couchioplanes caeruleus subsp. caeruleus]ROP21228.1 hypothetical protein EDD30_7622 [Couchioplanes caeruleus]
MSDFDPRRVHLPAGFLPAGRRSRAVCTCGHPTTPRADEARALTALLTEHGSTRPVCSLCGRDFDDFPREALIGRSVQILTDPVSRAETLVCKDAPQSCREGAAQRQVQLDRAAYDELGIEGPRPRLTVLPGGKQ